MATLKQLIANGLKVGQLVKSEFSNGYEIDDICIWQNDGKKLIAIKNTKYFRIGDIIKFSHKAGHWQLTTAYDSNIDPDVLPVPEPFATGWIIASHLDEPHKIFPNTRTEEEGFTAEGGWFQIEINSKPEKKWQMVHKTQCRPCLPLKNTNYNE